MNGSTHVKYMLLGGAGIVGVLVLLGYPLGSAVLLGAVLACPLMMVFMMSGGHAGHGMDQSGNREHDRVDHTHGDTPPRATHQYH